MSPLAKRRRATLGVLHLLLFASGCGNTGGALIQLPFLAGGVERDPGQPLTFDTPAGWTVTLDGARIALGPFYFNVSPPRSDAFRSGTVIVQATEQRIVDVLDPTLQPLSGGADGETGQAVAVEIGLLPPDSHASIDDSRALGSNVGLVSGTATRGGTTIAFSGPIVIDRSLATPQVPLEALQRVNGAAADLTFAPAGQQLELRVDPRAWFDGTDFSALPAGAPRTWSTGSTFLVQLLAGVRRQTDVYLFSLTGAPP